MNPFMAFWLDHEASRAAEEAALVTRMVAFRAFKGGMKVTVDLVTQRMNLTEEQKDTLAQIQAEVNVL